MFLYSFYELPKKSVVGLINRYNKQILISGTTDAAKYLSRIVGQLRSKDVALSKLRASIGNVEFIVIETLDANSSTLRIKEKAAEWYNYYKSIGYELIGKRVSVGYRLVVIINKEYKVEVSLVTKGGLKKVVGLFDTEGEASRFIKSAYKDPKNIEKLITHESAKHLYND